MSTGLPSPASGAAERPPAAGGATPEDPAPDRAPTAQAEPTPAPPGARRARWAPSPSFSGREIALVALGAVLLAVLTTWPLVLHLPSRISPDLGDPVRTAWEIAWVGHAMLHSPGHIFDSNAFYPHPLSLAFSDSLLGYGPAGLIGSGTVAALVRYNLLFLFAYSLCLLGAYLLARELGLGRLGAAAAGIAFAYAPYRVTEAGHLHVISSGGIALALFLLLRGYRRGSAGLVLAGWLVSAWQVSLGFTLGLQYCYLLLVLALLVGLAFWRGRPPARPFAVTRTLVIASAVGATVLGAVTIYQARPYLKVSHDYPTAKRTIREVENYSSGPAALVSASSENRVWGGATAGARAHVHSKNEDVFFPGGLILALSLLGLLGIGGSRLTLRLRLGLLAGVVVCSVLAMGLGLTGAGYPYRLLYDYAPGWDGVRVPGRVFTMATLFYALLAGAGAQWLLDRARPLAARLRSSGGGGTPRLASALPALAGGLLLIGLLGEGAGHLGHPVVPQPSKAEVGLPGPRLDLPTDGAHDRIWQYFSTDGFYKIPIGNSTFDIPAVDDLRGGMNGFPDKASIEKLRHYGIKTVVLHLGAIKDLPPTHGDTQEPPDPAAAARKPIAGLGVTRRVAGSSVIYEIGAGPAALHATD
ncbi:MAG TPA: hypothetical protein VNV44_00495 [Solirubrobacteraceae bacterium]|nr:hypothetical protein [Solirubrobacteraceae bacterium]